MTPQLRPACPTDASSLATLSLEVWVGTYLRNGISAPFADFALSEFAPQRMRALIDDPGECILVSQNTDGIDGYIRITHACPDPVTGMHNTEISTLYVQPRHHGKGIGYALLMAGCNAARDAGATSIWLATNSENTPALAFYVAQGFRQIGITHFRMKDQAYQNDVLVRSLAE